MITRYKITLKLGMQAYFSIPEMYTRFKIIIKRLILKDILQYL